MVPSRKSTRADASSADLIAGAIWSGSHTDGGWPVGEGIEYAFADNWTGKLEYDVGYDSGESLY